MSRVSVDQCVGLFVCNFAFSYGMVNPIAEDNERGGVDDNVYGIARRRRLLAHCAFCRWYAAIIPVEDFRLPYRDYVYVGRLQVDVTRLRRDYVGVIRPFAVNIVWVFPVRELPANATVLFGESIVSRLSRLPGRLEAEGNGRRDYV